MGTGSPGGVTKSSPSSYRSISVTTTTTDPSRTLITVDTEQHSRRPLSHPPLSAGGQNCKSRSVQCEVRSDSPPRGYIHTAAAAHPTLLSTRRPLPAVPPAAAPTFARAPSLSRHRIDVRRCPFTYHRFPTVRP